MKHPRANQLLTEDDCIRRLWQYGFLRDQPEVAILETALAAYQAFYGLEVHGELSAETIRHLMAQRSCRHPDVMADTLSGNANKWPDGHILWTLVTYPSNRLTEQQTMDALTWAWSQWSSLCGITPQFTHDQSAAHVLCSFGPIDGVGQVLAYSEMANNTMSKKTQQFDSAEAWCYSEQPPQGQIDLGRVACHEIGHILGIPHIAAGNLLQPMYSLSVRTPQLGDINEAVTRYGQSQTQKPVPPVSSAIPDASWAIQITGQGAASLMHSSGVQITQKV